MRTIHTSIVIRVNKGKGGGSNFLNLGVDAPRSSNYPFQFILWIQTFTENSYKTGIWKISDTFATFDTAKK